MLNEKNYKRMQIIYQFQLPELLLSALRRLKKEYLIRTAKINPNPIFVLGNPKSGTSVISMLLGKSIGETVQNDLFHFIEGRKKFREKLYQRELSFRDFIRANPYYFSASIVKDPNLTFFYEDIVKNWPESKLIFIVRDPRDNIRSLLSFLKIPGDRQEIDCSSYLSKLKLHKGNGWKETLEGNQPKVLGSNYIEKLANIWNLAADTYLNNRDNIVLIRFEDFEKDKVGAIVNLARKVGREPKYDINDYKDIQYQPRGKREVSWIDFFGSENLQKIETICGDRMSLLDYQRYFDEVK